MIKNLRKRFIFFCMLVIVGITALIGIYVFSGPTSNLPVHRYVFSLSLVIIMAFIGSWLLSKMAIRPIQDAWQKQLDFTADASHELRTPISTIQTNLELIMDSPSETVETQMKWLNNIAAENNRMARLVEDLLTLSRADTGQPLLQTELFMINEALVEAISPLVPIAEAKGLSLDINAGINIAFNGDRKRFMQLAVILADNAICYTDTGTVTVDLIRSDKVINLMVTDTGCGIEARHISKLFDRFYRIPETRAMKWDGSGLGLAIANWIVKEHGGTIEVTSTPGAGSTFEVCLPNRLMQ